MDLNAANLSGANASRLTRMSMIACFAIASAILIASLATAKTSVGAQTTALSNSTQLNP